MIARVISKCFMGEGFHGWGSQTNKYFEYAMVLVGDKYEQPGVIVTADNY